MHTQQTLFEKEERHLFSENERGCVFAQNLNFDQKVFQLTIVKI
jgi:hypothetical protein